MWAGFPYTALLVRHRIDGLEIKPLVIALASYVRHRIDGLEKVVPVPQL